MKKQILLGVALGATVVPAEISAQQKGEQKRPNILFCIADDATYYHFSAAGCTWNHTPNYDRVAREGIHFNRCYTPNAKSAPSRSIILTGMYSWQLKEGGNHITNFPEDVNVFTEQLQENGYTVAYTAKGWAPGNPGKKNGKKRQLTGTPYNRYKTKAPTKCMNSNDYSRNFIDFLDDQDGEKPWFFWYGCTEPHRRYEYGTGVSLGKKSTDMIGEVPAFWPDNDKVRNDMLDYGYEIEYFDHHLGVMLDELEKRGMLENTLVVVTADNGMPFPRCKANDYEYANHMPCAMMWPDGIVHPGREVSSYVSFIDFAPTFLELSQVKIGKDEAMNPTGKSLLPFLKDKVSRKELKERKSIILGRERDDYGRPDNQGYPIRALIRENILLIWNVKPHLFPAGNAETGYLDVDGSPTKTDVLNKQRSDEDRRYYELSFGIRPEVEMYDIVKDPYCMENLAELSQMHALREKMLADLKAALVEQEDPRMGEDGDIFDRYVFDSEDKWNFYERVVSGELKEPWKQTDWVNPTDFDAYLKFK